MSLGLVPFDNTKVRQVFDTTKYFSKIILVKLEQTEKQIHTKYNQMTKWQFSQIDLHTLIWESKQTRGSQHLISQCLYTHPFLLIDLKAKRKRSYLVG